MRNQGDTSAKSDAIADAIRADILAGRLAPGAVLPSERDLATTRGLSRPTVRAALGRLVSEGLLRSVHGSGTRVLDWRENGGISTIAHLARLAVESGRVPMSIVADLLEVRRVIGAEAVGLASLRATGADIDDLKAHWRTLASLREEPRRFMVADIAFAKMIVRATHNLPLELLASTVARIVETTPAMDAFFGDPDATLSAYAALIELIAAGEVSAARDRARAIFEDLDQRLLERGAALAERFSELSGSRGRSAQSAKEVEPC